jgi:hypothetical protein
MSEEKSMSEEVRGVALGHAMRTLVETLFEMPEEMRVRALDALNELVGPSRADLAAAEEAREAALDVKHEQRQMMLITVYAQLAQALIGYLNKPTAPAEPYPPPPPPMPPQDEAARAEEPVVLPGNLFMNTVGSAFAEATPEQLARWSSPAFINTMLELLYPSTPG